MIKFKSPIFTNNDVQKILDWNHGDFKLLRLDMIFPVVEGEKGLEKALENLCRKVEKKVDEGYNLIILSDRATDKDHAPIPSLLASAGVHHHLIRVKKRTRIGLIVETAETREVMHFALLFGYSVDAVNPYGVYATVHQMVEAGELEGKADYVKAEKNFIKAIEREILKVLSKMEISTLRSYRAAQIFEEVGLGKELINRYFTRTQSRIGGIGLKEVAQETLLNHRRAYEGNSRLLEAKGVYSYRKKGEKHAWNPESIYLLQWSTRTNDSMRNTSSFLTW